MPEGQNFLGNDLVVVTGGAGFIGSNIVLELAKAGERVVVCDLFRTGEKWRNLAAARLHDIVRPDVLFEWLARHRDKVGMIVHMGAISSTTENDVDRFVAANIRLSLDLWQWCAANGTRLIYASSAATYGDGSAGFSDEQSPAALAALRPLNAYGWSKHVVDRRVVDDVVRGQPTPPQWAGLKFFNVYGPNEDHKGVMQSLVSQDPPDRQSGRGGNAFQVTRSALRRWGPAARFHLRQRLCGCCQLVAAKPDDERLVQCRNRHGTLVPRPGRRSVRGRRMRSEYPICRHARRATWAISIFHSSRHQETTRRRLRRPVLLAGGWRKRLSRPLIIKGVAGRSDPEVDGAASEFVR